MMPKFVQVIEGTTSDRVKLKAIGSDSESELQQMRPDGLGGIVAWHPDGKGFTQGPAPGDDGPKCRTSPIKTCATHTCGDRSRLTGQDIAMHGVV